MYTFSYIDTLDYTADGGPKLYRIQDTDTSKYYYVDFNLVASSTEAIDYLKKYGIVRFAAITGATKTKVTYDSRGLVTAGADATTADIADSTNKRYVTDAQLTVIGNTSGTNTGDQTLGSLGGAASGANTDITSVLLNQTGLVVKGGDANALTIKPNETLTAGRTLNIIVGDASRTLTLTGDATISGTNTGDQTLGSLGAAASGSNSDITALNSVLTLVKVVQSGLKLQDTATKLLTIKNDNTLGANRTLNIQVADADRTIALSGNLTVSSAATISGTNTGDQTITLTGNVTGSGTGSFAATIANGAVTEAKMTLADNTTNDVSVSAHGFLPKAPNDVTKHFRGDAIWARTWNLVLKTADEDRSSGTTLTADSTLAFAMAASTNYLIRIRVFFTAGAGDFKYSLTGPGSPTSVRVVRKHIDPTNLTTLVTTSEAAVTGSTSLSAGAGTTGGWVELECVWINGSNTTPNFSFQWARNSASGTTTVLKGSYMEYTVIA